LRLAEGIEPNRLRPTWTPGDVGTGRDHDIGPVARPLETGNQNGDIPIRVYSPLESLARRKESKPLMTRKSRRNANDIHFALMTGADKRES